MSATVIYLPTAARFHAERQATRGLNWAPIVAHALNFGIWIGAVIIVWRLCHA